MSKLLEYIVRNVITELTGKLDFKWRSLNDSDRAFLNQNAIPLLGIKTADRTDYKKFGGVILTVTRRFGREQAGDSGTKSFNYGPSQIKNDIRSMLNSLSASYNAMKSVGYVWLVTTDIKPVEPDSKEKSEKIITKYEFLCMYVSLNSLTTNIDPKTKGYLYSLDDGALVFDWDSIDAKQWKRQAQIVVDEPILVKAPYQLVSYNEKSQVVSQLYNYFDLNSAESVNSIGFTMPADLKFNCDLKSVIEWFQKTNNIPVTGNWDITTRNKALSIDDAPYIIPKSDHESIRSAAATCKLNSGEVAKDINTITVPDGGFKYGITKDLNFWPVQLAMLSKYEELANKYSDRFSVNDPIYVKLKRAIGTKTNPGQLQGDYDYDTREMVKFFKSGFEIKTSAEIVEQEFINKLLQ